MMAGGVVLLVAVGLGGLTHQVPETASGFARHGMSICAAAPWQEVCDGVRMVCLVQDSIAVVLWACPGLRQPAKFWSRGSLHLSVRGSAVFMTRR